MQWRLSVRDSPLFTEAPIKDQTEHPNTVCQAGEAGPVHYDWTGSGSEYAIAQIKGSKTKGIKDFKSQKI